MAKKTTEDAPRINRILVSQPRPLIPNSPFEVLAKKAGVELVFEPFIHVEEVSANDFRKQRIDLAKFPSVEIRGSLPLATSLPAGCRIPTYRKN